FTTLQPGDLLLTGTPGKVPTAKEAGSLVPGQRVTATVEGIGSCVNRTVPDPLG
ncbi:MAG: fumarylacetoacetate hydrolase family protein, partial [Acidimicrobiia bacterium]